MLLNVERLVVAVAAYPLLYDCTKSEYHKPEIKLMAWEKISEAVNASGLLT